VQPLDARDRHHHAEDAVVPARVPHGVEVGTEDEGFLAASFVAADEVADLVTPRTHPGRAHPAGNDVVYPAHGLRTVRPVDKAGLLADVG
jgi:hypothetical protein